MLSKGKVEQIRLDAKEYAKIVVYGPTQWDDENTPKKTGYIRGATVEAERARILIDALKKIREREIDESIPPSVQMEAIATDALTAYQSSQKVK